MDIYNIQVSPDRIVRVQANSPEEAAAGARKVLARESGQSIPDGALTAAAQGSTFGYGDEILAAADAALGKGGRYAAMFPAAAPIAYMVGRAFGSADPSQAATFGQRYDENLARERGDMKDFAAAHPTINTAANIAGNVGGAIAALPAAATAAGPSMLGNAARMAATGGVLGGVQGFGEGEGGLENRAAHSVMPAVIGAGVGAAMPFAGAALRKAAESAPGRWVGENVVSPLARTIAGVFGDTAPRPLSAAAPDGAAGSSGILSGIADATGNMAQTGAVDRLATAFQRSGLTREQAERQMSRLGPEAMLADLDPQIMSAARASHTMPGQTRSWAPVVLEGRDRQAGNRMVSAFEGEASPPSSYALRGEGQAFDQNARAVGQRAYGGMRDAGLTTSGEMNEMLRIPAVRDALVQIEADAQSTGKMLSPVEFMHRVKQKLNDTAEAAFASGRPINKADMGQLASDWEAAFWRANPAARDADAAYRQAKSLPEYFDRGRDFLARGSSERATDSTGPALADLLAGADAQQIAAARAGSTNAARETALEGTAQARALAKRIDESAPVRDKLVQLYGSEQADRIMQQAATERTFARTSTDILGNSKTADKLAEVMDVQGLMPPTDKNSLLRKLVGLPEYLRLPNEAVRDEIGRATLNPSAPENARLLAAAFETIRRRQAGSPMRASISAAAADQSNR